jgi:uncharacterized membrane protein YbhN (UPF0104 family)
MTRVTTPRAPLRLIRLLVPLGLLALLWHLADGPDAAARLAGAQPQWLALSLAAVLGQTALSAWRWRLVARALGIGIAPGRALGEYLAAQFLNQTLPGGIPGDAARAWRSRGEGGLARAALAVAAERLIGQAALALWSLPALALSLAFGRIAWPQAMPWALAFAAVLLAAATRLPLPAAARPLAAPPGLWPAQAALAVPILALNLAAFACAARATGTTLTPEATAALVPLILTAMLIPLSVGGWGWREGAAALLFPLAGAAPEAGLAASAAFGAVVQAAAVPGVFWLIGRPAD